MVRVIIVLLTASVFLSCSKKNSTDPVVTPIPDVIQGYIRDIRLTPSDINTPDQGYMTIQMNDQLYKVDFDVVPQAEGDAILFFDNDTILVDDSREYANFGQDDVAYNPVKANEIFFSFDVDAAGKRVEGTFDAFTTFGGTFGQNVISEWRTQGDPTKPTGKAESDIRALIAKYMDSNGADAGIVPLHLKVNVSRQ